MSVLLRSGCHTTARTTTATPTPDDHLDGDGLGLADDCDDADPAVGGPEIPDDGGTAYGLTNLRVGF